MPFSNTMFLRNLSQLSIQSVQKFCHSTALLHTISIHTDFSQTRIAMNDVCCH